MEETKRPQGPRKKRKSKYKLSRLLMVIVTFIITIVLLITAVKYLLSVLVVKEYTPEELQTVYETQITTAKGTLGENILYVQATLKDENNKKHNGIAVISEQSLLFLDKADYSKQINLSDITNTSVSGSSKYTVTITTATGETYELTNIPEGLEAEGFIAILTR